MMSLLRLIRRCVEVVPPELDRLPILEEAALTVLADAEREMQRPADLVSVREAVAAIRRKISARQAESA